MPTQHVILFDIDGTLLSTPATEDSEKRRYVDTIRDVVGKEPKVIPSRFAGMVDPQICKILLTELGLSSYDVDKFLPQVLARMGEVYRNMDKRVVLNNGVMQLLTMLAPLTNLVSGVLTGNLTAVAEDKLTISGIREYFSVLFCANDYFDRTSLVQSAVRTCMTKHELNTSRDVVIVGDTPLDMKAAQASKTTPVGVATGVYTKAQLAEAGAEFVYSSLEPTNELLAGLGVIAHNPKARSR